MGRYERFVTLLMGVAAWLVGCQQIDHGAAAPYAMTNAEARDAGPRVTARQAAEVQVAMGRTLERRGDLSQAMSAYQDAIRRDPERPDAHQRLAVLYDRAGRFQDSEPEYRKALRAAPGDAEVYCDLGYSYYVQRRWAEAETALHQALGINPDHARTHNNLGMLLARTDRYPQALEEFHRAGCNAAQARANLALALAMDGRWDDAHREYAEALREDPSLEVARAGLRGLERAAWRAQAANPKTLAGAPIQTVGFAPAEPGSSVARTFFRLSGE